MYVRKYCKCKIINKIVKNNIEAKSYTENSCNSNEDCSPSNFCLLNSSIPFFEQRELINTCQRNSSYKLIASGIPMPKYEIKYQKLSVLTIIFLIVFNITPALYSIYSLHQILYYRNHPLIKYNYGLPSLAHGISTTMVYWCGFLLAYCNDGNFTMGIISYFLGTAGLLLMMMYDTS